MTATDERRRAEGSSGALGLSAHPDGLRTLYFTELWERFSYYGMRALLTLFMVAPIAQGGLGFATVDAGSIYGTYTMAVYMLSIPGGYIADRILGARRAVMIGGITIAAGHFAMAYPTLQTFYLGLILIALGTGLFKPNISALVGALYAPDDHRRDAGFSLFYMGINIGAFLAPLVTGFMAQSATFKNFLASAGFDPGLSWHWGFGAAGVGMTIAILLFMRRAHELPEPAPVKEVSQALSADVLKGGLLVIAGTLALLGLAMLSDSEGYTWLRWMFIAIPLGGIALALTVGSQDARQLAATGVFFLAAMIFWAIFEQQGLTISLFADQLTRNDVAGIDFPSSWYQSINPIFVILLTPFVAALWVHLGLRQPTPAVKFAIGLALLSLSFALLSPAAELSASGRVSPLWLVGVLFLMTAGELLLSPVGLSTMTRLAPMRMTGLVLGIWFLAAAFGNKLAGILGGGFHAANAEGMAFSFLAQAGFVAVAALLMFLAAPWVNRLSGKA